MEWVLQQHPVIIVAVHVGAVSLSVIIFYGIDTLIESVPNDYQRWFALGIEFWLGLLIVLGLVVFANNLSVIILGEPLFEASGLPLSNTTHPTRHYKTAVDEE